MLTLEINCHPSEKNCVSKAKAHLTNGRLMHETKPLILDAFSAAKFHCLVRACIIIAAHANAVKMLRQASKPTDPPMTRVTIQVQTIQMIAHSMKTNPNSM